MGERDIARRMAIAAVREKVLIRFIGAPVGLMMGRNIREIAYLGNRHEEMPFAGNRKDSTPIPPLFHTITHTLHTPDPWMVGESPSL